MCEVTHGKNVYCRCYGFMLRLRKRGKIGFDDLPPRRRRGGDTNYVRRNDYEKQRSKRDSCSIISGSVFYDSTTIESTGSAGGSNQFSTGSSEDGE